VVPRIADVCVELNRFKSIKVIPGVEITHVPVESIGELVKMARSLGAKIVVVHGETLVEPVPVGTNQAAIIAGVDILAHPGLITENEVILAKQHSVFLEVSGRKGHSLANGHVVSLAKKIGARLIFNSDSHAPGDLINKDLAMKILQGAGLDAGEVRAAQKNSMEIVERV
jgi:histidinol phosphatase-like PHP family hydrolase